jgi:hypothetical protein
MAAAIATEGVSSDDDAHLEGDFSGYRFCLAARDMGKPIAAVNLGRTRADDLLALKVVGDCGEALSAAAESLRSPLTPPGGGE